MNSCFTKYRYCLEKALSLCLLMLYVFKYWNESCCTHFSKVKMHLTRWWSLPEYNMNNIIVFQIIIITNLSVIISSSSKLPTCQQSSACQTHLHLDLKEIMECRYYFCWIFFIASILTFTNFSFWNSKYS